MRVMLVSLPYIKDFMRNARCDYQSLSATQWYPIWLSYCGALLEKYGHLVEIVDAPAERIGIKATIKKVSSFHPELLVVYSSTKSQNQDIDFAEYLKEIIKCKVVFVGPFVSIAPREILNNSRIIDYSVKGEFEYPVLELTNGLELHKIQNLVYRYDGNILENSLRPNLMNKELDELPFVTRFYKKHLNLKNYKVPSELYPFIDLFTGRGCAWGRCIFCLWVYSFIPGSTYNKRSIDNVIEEIRYVCDEIPEAKEIFIQDDMLPADRARELSLSLINNRINIRWGCYVKGNLDIDTLKMMKESGCRILHVGYESANKEVLKNIKKGLTVNIMTEFTANAKKAGLKIHGDFIFGLPGETIEGIKKTIRWAKKLDPDTAQFSLMNPYESTPFYDYLKKNNYLNNGEPDYPHLCKEEIRRWARKAIREFYLSPRYALRVIKDPYEYFFLKIRTMQSALPRMFWKKW